MNTILNSMLVILLVSCGAATNSNPVVDNNRDNDPNRPNQIGSNGELRSQMNRTKGTPVTTMLNIQKLSKDAGSLTLPEGYSEVPNESNHEDSIKKIVHSEYERDCGILNVNTTTVEQRISNCTNIYGGIGVLFRWEANKFGMSGEGDWSLVSVTTKPQKSMVWLDQTTGLLWTDILETVDWNKAAESERRICKEYMTTNTHFFTDKQVAWRLPTRSDFLQADINGARYVLDNTDNTFWTASLINETLAWSINQATGATSQTSRDSSLYVRCVGVVLK